MAKHHGLAISHSHLKRLATHASSMQHRLARASQKTEHALDCVLDTGITLGTSAALGFVHGRFGLTEVGGVPMELVGGAAAFGLGVFGFGGRHADKLVSVGNGLLSPYSYDLARGLGMNLKDQSGAKKLAAGAPAAVTGRLPTQALTDAERAVMRAPVEAQR